MHAFATESADLAYLGQPPVLIAATSDGALALAEQTIEAAGLRVGAKLRIKEARDRLESQAAVTALWIEVDRDLGDELDELLGFIGRRSDAMGFATIVSTSADLIDPIIARLGDADVEFLVDPSKGDRFAVLALAIANRGFPQRISDVSKDANAERLRQLSEEVSRIASKLVSLSTDPPIMARPEQAIEGEELPAISVETIRNIIRARRLRARYFDDELFADPAWDMLLDLLQAEISQLRIPVSSLCISASVPATTALRWIKKMVSEGIIIRRPDPHDGRRVFIELDPKSSLALQRYFAEAGKLGII
jgi:DNA-binding MarR family transcriptional regulator